MYLNRLPEALQAILSARFRRFLTKYIRTHEGRFWGFTRRGDPVERSTIDVRDYEEEMTMTKEEMDTIKRAELLIAKLRKLLEEPTPKPRPILPLLTVRKEGASGNGD